MFKMMLWYLPSSVLLWFLLCRFSDPDRFAAQLVFDACIGVPLFLHFGVPDSLKEEFYSRIPQSIRPLIGWILFRPSEGLK